MSSRTSRRRSPSPRRRADSATTRLWLPPKEQPPVRGRSRQQSREPPESSEGGGAAGTAGDPASGRRSGVVTRDFGASGLFQDVLDRVQLEPVREVLGNVLEARIPEL